jgi:hypothetical protein
VAFDVTVATPSGLHLYFRVSADDGFASVIGWLPGVDVRGLLKVSQRREALLRLGQGSAHEPSVTNTIHVVTSMGLAPCHG